MRVQGKVFDLTARHLLALDRAVPLDAKALENSAFSVHHHLAGRKVRGI
jgi:hypothetical protein